MDYQKTVNANDTQRQSIEKSSKIKLRILTHIWNLVLMSSTEWINESACVSGQNWMSVKESFLKRWRGRRRRKGGGEEQWKTKFKSSDKGSSESEPSLVPSAHAIRRSYTGVSHLGRYTSTFCFFTEFAHSSISWALTNGSSVDSGTSCLDNTSIILMASPSYGISSTW